VAENSLSAKVHEGPLLMRFPLPEKTTYGPLSVASDCLTVFLRVICLIVSEAT
jgi:hypothetical protein